MSTTDSRRTPIRRLAATVFVTALELAIAASVNASPATQAFAMRPGAGPLDEFPSALRCKPFPAPINERPACGPDQPDPVEEATAESSPLRLAGGDPPTVVDSRSGPRLPLRG